MSVVRANTFTDAAGTGNAVFNGYLATPGGMSFKNRLINDFRIDQRNNGAAVTLTAANFVYPVDRWFAFRSSGTSGATAQRVTGSLVGGNALRIQRTAGNTATDVLGFGQVIESVNCIGFAGNTITKTFRARCGANFSASGSQIVSRIGTGTGTDQSSGNFYNNAWTGQSNTNTTITLTTSWQTFTVTITAGSTVNQAGVMFYWTPSGTAGADDWVEIEQVDLRRGNQGAAVEGWEFRPYATELQLCQRYFQTNGAAGGNLTVTVGQAYSSSQAIASYTLPVVMRAIPTLSIPAGATWAFLNASQSSGVGGTISVAGASNNGIVNFALSGATGLTAGNASALVVSYHGFQLSSEL